ncbi:hypothetical protein E1A91_A01G180700v1 [Gossypium mustelinum]|uniref:Uncharacterized protein n=1 Tax=Gossypium mustelinum TaxID=34275 RepID=A0A5D3AJL4_GOSMU|nr:hypothetical protein E1A91_A01G180700v1 [Gossypium mustelinum]
MSYLFSCRKTFSLLFFTLITNLNNDHSPFLIIFVRRSPPLLLISVCWPHLFIFVSSSLSIDLCPYQVFISCLHFEETLKNKNKNNLSSPIKKLRGLGSSTKKRKVKQLVHELKVQIFIIRESKIGNCADWLINYLWPSNGNFGGLIIIWDSFVFCKDWVQLRKCLIKCFIDENK